jgi:hypothetical protein
MCDLYFYQVNRAYPAACKRFMNSIQKGIRIVSYKS